ncbi:YraN family protein [Pseudothermotoga sp.]|uniref:YraN family protein n=1 Tax=Pseudothermotoga sp. TaxID=2033661 RepID=UPI0031F668AB
MNWKEAEEVAAKFLRKKGYKIIERNFRTRFGEIDIVTRYGEYLVFVEVKSGKSELSPRTRVDRSKVKRIELAVGEYLIKRKPKYEALRIDVVEVSENGIEHIEGFEL